ncbi:MAG: flagellin [Peptococcales bacterium]|jgi:flagellin
MRINHNIAALNTYRQLGANSAQSSKNLEKLSSGLRINRAGDDAAGLAISEKMRGQIRGLEMASKNAQDGISFIQTAEGALNETHSILQRMRELAVQSANDTNIGIDRNEIQKEVDQLAQEITRIANNTEFNQQTLLNGGITKDGIGDVKFHIGANEGQNINLEIKAMDASSLGVARDINRNAQQESVKGDIASASFNNDKLGSAIKDKAEITFAFTPGQAATKAKVTGTNDYAVNTDLGGKTAVMTIEVGDKTFSIDATRMAGWNGTGDIDALVAFIGNADTNGDGTGTKLSSVATVTNSGNKIVIENNTAGAQTVKVTFSGADAGDAQTLTGFAGTETDTGNAFISDKVTLASGGVSQEVAVDGTKTSMTVGTGSFAGLTINMDTSKTLADLDSTDDGVTVKAETVIAQSAKFNGGTLESKATAAAGIDVSNQESASAAITKVQRAIETVSAERSKLGAYQNRLEHTINNLGTSAENLTAAESRIRDVDMAKEMMEFTKNNILQQAAQAMLAQANQQPQGVLQLLR